MNKKWFLISLINFFAAACMGLLLRLMNTGLDLGLKFNNLLHAHSHTAMMGWVYMGLFSLIYHFFLSDIKQDQKKFSRLFWITETAILGIIISFPLQGYAFFSITFCVIHLFCSYYFAYLVFKQTKGQKSQSLTLLRTALWLLIASTLGLWGIAPAIAIGGRGSSEFSVSLQVYLHFQFNGYFFFAVLALLFKKFKLNLPAIAFKQAYLLLIISTLLTFTLPISWYYPLKAWYYLNLAGAFMMYAAFVYGYDLLRDSIRKSNVKISKTEKQMFNFATVSLTLRMVAPLFLVYPDLMHLSFEIRSLVIGFIHLVMLGVISGYIGFFFYKSIDLDRRLFNLGFHLLAWGFILTEIMLFTQGVGTLINLPPLPHFYSWMAIFSMFLPAGVALWMLSIRETGIWNWNQKMKVNGFHLRIKNYEIRRIEPNKSEKS